MRLFFCFWHGRDRHDEWKRKYPSLRKNTKAIGKDPLSSFFLIFLSKKSKWRITYGKDNLKDFYPFYKHDLFIEIPDKVEELLKFLMRKEHADHERRRVHRAYFSLDANDGIEKGDI